MNDNKKTISFIINPISGTHSKKALPKLIEETLDHELFDHRILFTEYAGHASELTKRCGGEN